MSLEIQIVSDLHLEFHANKLKFNIFKPTAKVLALLGDICCCGDDSDFEIFKRFINEIQPNYKLIIMISGNHEYYFNPNKKYQNIPPTMQVIDTKIKKYFKSISTPTNTLIYLNNSSISLTVNKKKYLICGTTLWSNVLPEHYKRIEESMSDYNYIYIDQKKKLTASHVQNMFKRNYKFLKNQMIKATNEKQNLIIFTHHCPFVLPTFDINGYDMAYYSDCKDLFKTPSILIAYGHTHKKYDNIINNIRVVSNPRGYPYERTEFNKEFSVKV